MLFSGSSFSHETKKTQKFQPRVPHLSTSHKIKNLQKFNFRAFLRISRKMRPRKLLSMYRSYTEAKVYTRFTVPRP